ncbi:MULTISPECIES: ArgP/LysG family DNA-binding transcriptional regulator [Deefgea]|uniref:ArgP/LysG family DNA-binding transcriptional regulator n=1 Tax=Deefgea chitinilytica TaxID=570276 RepID=A0ABS2C826_9NEIS|nr:MULTISPECIES: ArgP/LysG family DNA-binding transcriptional regulator [Deefgea]MBM5570301.1 ArgP/LysG family DNA-binding transcriptional regulator [Deefgea chitinilytica]MBM9887530.1 ArgP/LysG family DNA-binding transcriptional regulator [Deefgea sp. CFH1-16]
MFDYKLLEALDMILRCGSFDAAAKRLHLTPSAISQRIRQLEERHGEVLLRRENPLRATATGEKLLAHVRQVRLLENDFAQESDATSAALTTLRVGITADSLAIGLIPALAPSLVQTNLLLECVIDDEAYTLDLLRSGEVIGCISTQPLPFAGCGVIPLGELPYIGVASPAFVAQYFSQGINASSLAAAPAAVYGRIDSRKESLHRRLLREQFALLEDQYPCFVIPESHALYAAAQAGLAYAVVPCAQAEADIAAGRVLPLRELHASVPLYWHHWARQTRPALLLTQAMCQFAAEYFNAVLNSD